MSEYHVQVGLAEWIERPVLKLLVRRWNPALSENTTFLPRSLSLPEELGRTHCRISELSKGGGVNKKILIFERGRTFGGIVST